MAELSLSNLEGVNTSSIPQKTKQVNNELALSNLEGVKTTTLKDELS